MSTRNSSRYNAMRRRRVVIVLLAAAVVSLVARPIGRHALISLDLYKARRALDNVDLEGAIDWLQDAERRQPDRPDVQYWLAVAYRRHAQYRLAEEHLLRAKSLGWPKEELERQGMLILFQKGDVDQAETYMKNVSERGGSDDMAEDIYEAMTIGYLADYRLKDAILCLSLWTDWRPDSLRALLLRAYFHSAILPNPKSIEADLREVLRIAPGRLAERLALAELLLQQTRVDEAIAECETCRRQAPENPAVRLGIGMCRFRQGRTKEASLELESAVTAASAGDTALNDEQLARAFTTLGQIASSEREFQKAARYYTKAVQHAPQDPAPVYGLGIAQRTMGKDDLASQTLERCKTVKNQADRMGQIKMAISEDTTNVELRVEAATIMWEQGRKSEAANWMMSALYHEPKLRVAHELLADVCEEQGAHEQARHHREEARSGTELEVRSKLDGPATSDEN